MSINNLPAIAEVFGRVKVNPPVRALVLVAELGVYVAVYQAPDKDNADQIKSR